MTILQFYEGIGLDDGAKSAALFLEKSFSPEAAAPVFDLLMQPAKREEALAALRAAAGEDADGMTSFVLMAHCAAERTFAAYAARGIPEDVFWATMRFLSRFLLADSRKAGHPVFRWAWWFPRQLALQEFRIGALEYEMIEREGAPAVSVHIPADADFSNEAVGASLCKMRAFFEKFFPAYRGASVLCESWLLAPVLQELLPPTSRILAFQRRFEVLRVDDGSPAALEWIFPDPKVPVSDLPEDTSLRRAVKRHLLAGGRVGWTLGKLKD